MAWATAVQTLLLLLQEHSFLRTILIQLVLQLQQSEPCFWSAEYSTEDLTF